MQPALRFEEAPPPTPPAKPAGNGRPFPLTVAELHEMQDAPPRGGGDALVAFRLLNDVIGKPGDRGEGAAGEALAVRCRATNPDELRTEIRAQWPLPRRPQGVGAAALLQAVHRRYRAPRLVL